MHAISKQFGFPLTIGAVDGSHIRIKAPLQQLESYTNRKSCTSVVLQAICDSKMFFLDVSVGWPGSMHDARIFRLSAIGKRLANISLQPYHILGDSAYPLMSNIIVPFRNTGDLSPEERQFNTIHSASRCVIERAFARLKGKFRRLKYLDMDDMNLVGEIITAACVLHNFIIEHDSQASSSVDDDSEDDAAPEELANSIQSSTGVVRRQELLHMLT